MAVTFGLLALLPLTFPDLETASFFTTTLLEEPRRFDFLQFIPENPFSSLANNVVPAVVLFSIAVGVALMTIDRKRTLIDNLEILGGIMEGEVLDAAGVDTISKLPGKKELQAMVLQGFFGPVSGMAKNMDDLLTEVHGLIAALEEKGGAGAA